MPQIKGDSAVVKEQHLLAGFTAVWRRLGANRLDAADEKPSNSEAARAGLLEAEHKSAPAMLRTVRRSQDYG